MLTTIYLKKKHFTSKSFTRFKKVNGYYTKQYGSQYYLCPDICQHISTYLCMEELLIWRTLCRYDHDYLDDIMAGSYDINVIASISKNRKWTLKYWTKILSKFGPQYMARDMVNGTYVFTLVSVSYKFIMEKFIDQAFERLSKYSSLYLIMKMFADETEYYLSRTDQTILLSYYSIGEYIDHDHFDIFTNILYKQDDYEHLHTMMSINSKLEIRHGVNRRFLMYPGTNKFRKYVPPKINKSIYVRTAEINNIEKVKRRYHIHTRDCNIMRLKNIRMNGRCAMKRTR